MNFNVTTGPPQHFWNKGWFWLSIALIGLAVLVVKVAL